MDSRDLTQEFPWAGGFGFIRSRPGNARPMKEARWITSSSPTSEMTSNPGELYVIEYIEPIGPTARRWDWTSPLRSNAARRPTTPCSPAAPN
jgi:hypothetical protein